MEFVRFLFLIFTYLMIIPALEFATNAQSDEAAEPGDRANLALSVSLTECFNWLIGRKEISEFEHEAFDDISSMRAMDGSNSLFYMMREHDVDLRKYPADTVLLLADESSCEVTSHYDGVEGDEVAAWEAQFEEEFEEDEEFFAFAIQRQLGIHEFSRQTMPEGELRAAGIELDGKQVGWVLIYPNLDANGIDRITKENITEAGIRIVAERDSKNGS